MQSFARVGATVTGVWHRNGDLVATLDLDESSLLRRGWVPLGFYHDDWCYARIHIEQVDGHSAVVVVTLLNPPLPPEIPRTIAGLSP